MNVFLTLVVFLVIYVLVGAIAPFLNWLETGILAFVILFVAGAVASRGK